MSFNFKTQTALVLMIILSFLNGSEVFAKNTNTIIDQEHYQFYDNDGTTVNNATGLTAVDTAATVNFADIFHIRLGALQTANKPDLTLTRTVKLQYSIDAGGTCSAGSWTDVPTESGWTNQAFRQITTGNFVDNDATTARLDGTHTHIGGDGVETNGAPNSVSFTSGSNTSTEHAEWEWALEEKSGAADQYWFRFINSDDTTTNVTWTTCADLTTEEAVTPADLSWETGAADFEIWAGATATTDASLAWDNGTLICSASLNDDNNSVSTCGSINKNQTYRVQSVLENIGGTNGSMASGDFIDQVNVQTFWAGTSATLVDCGFNDTDGDDTSAACTVAYNATNNVRITQTGTEVLIAATTGTEGLMYRITTDNDVSLSNSQTYWNASIDSITEDSSKITIGRNRIPGLRIRGMAKIRGVVKFR